MKLRTLTLALFLAFTAILPQTGCQTPPIARVEQVQTLKYVGATAKGTMDSAAIALKNGKITVHQFLKIADVYDYKFQPAFSLAVRKVQSDLAPASPELIQFAADISTLLLQFSTNP